MVTTRFLFLEEQRTEQQCDLELEWVLCGNSGASCSHSSCSSSKRSRCCGSNGSSPFNFKQCFVLVLLVNHVIIIMTGVMRFLDLDNSEEN